MSAKRSIFEDVGEKGAAPRSATPGLIDRGADRGRRWVRAWFILIGLMVAAMVLVGGLTRLTDSGLSITQWNPVSGALPPMNAADWQHEFDLYQQTPQYQLQNQGMTLGEFKFIFWWEWAHRLLGRSIGLVWLIGLIGFAVTRSMPRGWWPRAIGIGLLGAVQGAIGWWMVSSGLTGRMVAVASYRLAIHLGIAFLIIALVAWWANLLSRPAAQILQARRSGERKLFGMATGVMHLAALQILLGALVAGIDAGRSFTDWPLMAGGFFPPQPFDLQPWWTNFFENPGTVQFMHRIVAYLLFIFGIVTWNRGRRSGYRRTRFAFNCVLAMLIWQVALGITTVLHAAPVGLSSLHQVSAMILWVAIVRARFTAQYPAMQSARGN